MRTGLVNRMNKYINEKGYGWKIDIDKQNLLDVFFPEATEIEKINAIIKNKE